MVVSGQIISEAEQQRIEELTAILRGAHGRAAEIWNRDVPGLHPYRIRPMIDDVLTIGRESFEVFFPRAGEGTDRVEAVFSEGLMMDGRGRPVNTVKWVEYMDGTTADVSLFCMDGEGRFILLPQGAFVMGQNRHHDIQRGMPMAACGEITVLQGKVTFISSATGHYRTPDDFLDQALTELRRHGALAADAIIEYYRPLR
jgi:hypothetical protein